MAALAPMPGPRVRMATAAKPGLRRSSRPPKRRSAKSVAIRVSSLSLLDETLGDSVWFLPS